MLDFSDGCSGFSEDVSFGILASWKSHLQVLWDSPAAAQEDRHELEDYHDTLNLKVVQNQNHQAMIFRMFLAEFRWFLTQKRWNDSTTFRVDSNLWGSG